MGREDNANQEDNSIERPKAPHDKEALKAMIQCRRSQRRTRSRRRLPEGSLRGTWRPSAKSSKLSAWPVSSLPIAGPQRAAAERAGHCDGRNGRVLSRQRPARLSRPIRRHLPGGRLARAPRRPPRGRGDRLPRLFQASLRRPHGGQVLARRSSGIAFSEFFTNNNSIRARHPFTNNNSIRAR